MTRRVHGGILRVASRIASTIAEIWRSESGAVVAFRWGITSRAIIAGLITVCLSILFAPALIAQNSEVAIQELTELESHYWDFSRNDDVDNNKTPDGWQRARGIGYPNYVNASIEARDPVLEKQSRFLDTWSMRAWTQLRKSYPSTPLPPSIADALVDRYLRIDLDGGQVKLQSPLVEASRMYQYRFSCQIMTKGLRHDSARAEFVFVDENNKDIVTHSTPPIRGTKAWTPISLDLVRPPIGATGMLVRLIVERSEDGLEDIRGVIGFDDVRIDQYPQLRITTNSSLGLYRQGRPVTATATIMGMPARDSQVQFHLFDSDDHLVSETRLTVRGGRTKVPGAAMGKEESKGTKNRQTMDSEVTWKLPRLQPGYYRVTASLVGRQVATLATETTIAVIDDVLGGPPHGAFGWTLPDGAEGISARDLGPWLADLGVAWIKYPCWLEPTDTTGAEEVATILSKLQDAGIQTIGMLDAPPESQWPLYSLRGRKDMVAAQLFRDVATWQPLLEPVMSRLTLKVRTWQLGGDRDHSFMGRPRLRDSISQVSNGLQGFGQPIDVAISWPWMERELPTGEASWQAVCRSSDPPMGARELDAFLSLRNIDSRGDGPRTWLLVDPISAENYSRDARIRDLVLRMATVRSHRVQAAFVSDPRDPDQGLLRPNGRPSELLLPWRTTSRLIGNLREVGSLQLRSGAENMVFAGGDRAVMLVWSAEPTEEAIYLGENVQVVDVWGRVRRLPVETEGDQPVHRLKIGPVPTFIIGADPTLLAFRMSVDVKEKQLDSFLGQVQKLTLSFANPTRESLIGELRLRTPKTWSIDAPDRSWEALGGRSATHKFDVVLKNDAMIGEHELPIQFEIETVPPKLITVYRKVDVGPFGLEVNVMTRLLTNGELRVQIELTNNGPLQQSYDCFLFPPPGQQQYQRRIVTINSGETVRREFYWSDGEEMIGQQMTMSARERDGPRVLNYRLRVRR